MHCTFTQVWASACMPWLTSFCFRCCEMSWFWWQKMHFMKFIWSYIIECLCVFSYLWFFFFGNLTFMLQSGMKIHQCFEYCLVLMNCFSWWTFCLHVIKLCGSHRPPRPPRTLIDQFIGVSGLLQAKYQTPLSTQCIAWTPLESSFNKLWTLKPSWKKELLQGCSF